MRLSSEIRHGRHYVSQLHVHLVFITKYGYRVLDGHAVNRLRAIFSKVSIDFGAELVEMDGEDNHVHLLLNYPPKHLISALVNSLKGCLKQDASP
jgi:putative transposase